MNSRVMQIALIFILINIFVFSEAQTKNRRMRLADQVLISEFMASNDTTVADEDGDFPDWIELHNATDSTIDVGGWYLTDSSDELTKWQLPSPAIIEANAYLLVFASDKNRAVSGSELHTNFKLSASGEYLGLVMADGITVESAYDPSYPVQFTDISYGIDEGLLFRYFATPTPGQANDSNSANPGATISQVKHSPEMPGVQEPIQVTAEISSAQNIISQVSLIFRPMFAPEQTVQMFDDGLHGDGAENDGTYGAIIPANSASTGEMIRYYISAIDAESIESRLPVATSTVNAPEYFGLVIADSSLESNLETLHWFVEDIAAAETRDGTRASIYYYGEFYDNIFVRVRGGFSSTGPKYSFKFDMNNGYWFQYADEYDPMEEFNINSTIWDQTSIRPMLAFNTYKDSGAFYSLAEAVRVHRNGAFYSVANFIEQTDERYLSRHNLDPDGALYKFGSGGALQSSTAGVEKKTRQNEDSSDLEALVVALSLENVEREKYLLDNTNIPTLVNYLALRTTTGDWDAVCKNYYMYRDTEGSEEWYILPWDKDASFWRWGGIHEQLSVLEHPLLGSETYRVFYNSSSSGCWNRLFNALFESPMLREMYLRRLRSVMDERLQASNTPLANRYLEANIDALLSKNEPDIQLDKATWSGSEPLDIALQRLTVDFLEHQRQELYGQHLQINGGLIPAQQVAAATIQIDTVEFNPLSDNPEDQFVRLYNPNNFAVDISQWQLQGETTFQLRSGSVIPSQGYLYLARDIIAFRDRDTSPKRGEGHFIIESGLEFGLQARTLSLLDANRNLVSEVSYGYETSAYASELLITEINYHPTDGLAADNDDYEFVELTNISDNAIDLTGFSFTNGISITLPLSTITADESIVLVKSGQDFDERYPLAGWLAQYDKSLSNGGERLTLIDSAGGLITTFEYDDKDPWAESADGDGFTLELRTPFSPPSLSCSWQASINVNGTPGTHTFVSNDICFQMYLPILHR